MGDCRWNRGYAFLCWLITVWLFAMPVAAAPAPAAPAPSEPPPPCGNGVYYLGEVTSDKDSAPLLEDVVGQMFTGLQELMIDNKSSSVHSIYELRKLARASRDAQILFEDSGGNASSAYIEIKSIWKGASHEVGIVKTDLRLIGDRYYLSVSLQCVGPKAVTPSLWRKAVREARDSQQTLRDDALLLGKELWEDEKDPNLKLSFPKTARVGDPVVLDASNTTDGDDDELFIDWELPPDAPPMRRSGSVLSFVPTKEGTLTFHVQAKEIAGKRRRSVNQAVTISIMPKPIVTVTGGGLVQMEDGRPTTLHAAGSCTGTERCAWQQISGPIVASKLPPAVVSGPQPLNLVVDQPGVYTLALVGRSEPLVSREVLSYVVAPKPAARLDAPSKVLYGYQYELDAHASYDAAGQPLSYRWEVSTKPFAAEADNCAPRANDDDQIILTEASEPVAHLRFARGASGEKTIYVRLTVTAERKVGADPISVEDCRTKPIAVRERRVFVYSAAGPLFLGSISHPKYDGIRVNLGVEGVVYGWFGLGLFTDLLRSDANDGSLHLGGGTSLEAIAYLSPVVSVHAGAFAKTYGGVTVGPDASVDLHCPFGFVTKGIWAYNIPDGLAHPSTSSAVSSLMFMAGWGHAL